MFVLYDGPSLHDGKPIVVIATGYNTPSSNGKTGPMIQTYILRKDISPVEALRSGDDESICFDCSLRGKSCYVVVHHGPRAVWDAYQNGRAKILNGKREIAAVGIMRDIRIGAYGDPLAAPFWVWEALVKRAAGYTGYTHQWKNGDQRMKQLCMASVDNEAEKNHAQSLGWRTYRVLADGEEPDATEIPCPASDIIKCNKCLLCRGISNAKSIAIPVHGTIGRRQAFNRLRTSEQLVVFNPVQLRKMPAHALPQQGRTTARA